jgi:hypothetical protein
VPPALPLRLSALLLLLLLGMLTLQQQQERVVHQELQTVLLWQLGHNRLRVQ